MDTMYCASKFYAEQYTASSRAMQKSDHGQQTAENWENLSPFW